MELHYIKAATAAVWVFVMVAAGVLAGISATTNWVILAGCAIVPPALMMRYWHHPDQSMSQTIQRVLR